MSAGAYELTRYQSNGGIVYSVRVQPETLALTVDGDANAAPVGAVTAEPSAIVSGSRRAIGVHTRGIRIRFTGTLPDGGYKQDGVIFLPILTSVLWNAISRGDVGTYLGSAIIVIGKTAEQIK